MIVDELVSLLGLKVDPKAAGEADNFGKLVGGVAKAAVAAGAALVAAAGAISAYAIKQAGAIDQAGKFADSLGITYENLQKLEYAQQRAGGTTDELRGDLDKLTKTMSSPIPGEFNQTFYQLGIRARNASGELRSADDVLLDIAKKFEGMSKQRQVQFAEKLGISPGTLKLIQQGRGGIEDLREEAVRLGLVLDENAKEKAARFQDSLLNSRSVVDALGKSIAVGLLPAMADSLDTFTDWIGANREFISSAITQVVEGVADGFSMFGDAVGYVYGLIVSFLGPIDSMISGLDATQAIAVTVAIALGAVAVAVVAATWPFIAIAAAIGAVILILDDLYSAFTGGDSIIGGWVSQFRAAFPEISGAIGSLLELLGKVAAIFGGALVTGVKQWGGVIFDIIGAVIDGFGDMLSAIEKLLSGANPFEVLGDLFQKQIDRILGLGSKLAGRIGDVFGGIFGSSAQAAAPVPASVVNSAGGNNSTINNNITNNVNGAGNPAAVANEIGNRGGFGQVVQQSRPGLTGPTVG
jgi:hypothetical protein